MLLVLVASFGAWILYSLVDPTPFKPGAEISLFAPMYIIAQSIERLLEPFTTWLGSASDEKGDVKNAGSDSGVDIAALPAEGKRASKRQARLVRDAAVARAISNTDRDEVIKYLGHAAKAQAIVDRIRRNRAYITWGIASMLAMLACGAFGIRLLSAIGFHVFVYFDVALTGLAIGSGTKPLHDLISNVQKAKEDKEDPANVATAR